MAHGVSPARVAGRTRSPVQVYWRRIKRFTRRYREVILIVLTLLMSLAFLGFGFLLAITLESQHPGWFGNGY